MKKLALLAALTAFVAAPAFAEEKVEAAQPAPVAKKDEKVADTSIALESEKQSVSSELVALPGVSDFSIIFSGDKFYPSVIRMKQNGNKNRLLFVSLGSKPAALVFVKPRIQRWISNESGNQSAEEFREVNSSKITEIEFSAEPGNYEYYDALSGARGEIKVE
ncbi:MAG: hypothetical protein EBR02_09615 [Alphaproteobacteria bacterium]|nr:hypothetical protein [Alphaproteobacteria bacterium]